MLNKCVYFYCRHSKRTNAVKSQLGTWYLSQNCMYSITWSLSQNDMIQSLGVCRKAAGILLLCVWCKYIRYNIPIITLVGVWPDGWSPLQKLGHPRASPRVTLLFSGRQTVGSHSNKGDNCIILNKIYILNQ